MLSPVGNNFVGISTVVITLETVKVTTGFLGITSQWHSNVTGIELTSIPATWDTSKAFEFIPTQCIQPFVSGCMLNKPGFVTKPVVAVFPHAVEMGLVLPVIAAAEGTVLIEPESHIAFRDRLILQHSHGGLQPHLLLLSGKVVFIHEGGHGTRPLEAVWVRQPRLEALQGCCCHCTIG
jgi:hypothetical protein